MSDPWQECPHGVLYRPGDGGPGRECLACRTVDPPFDPLGIGKVENRVVELAEANLCFGACISALGKAWHRYMQRKYGEQMSDPSPQAVWRRAAEQAERERDEALGLVEELRESEMIHKAALTTTESKRDEAREALRREQELRRAAQDLCTRSILPSSDSHALTEAQFQRHMLLLFDGPFQRKTAKATAAALGEEAGDE